MSTAPATSSPAWAQLRAELRNRWRSTSPRGRTAAVVAGLLLALLVVWMVAIQPAWRTLQDAPQQLDRLDAQLQQMVALAGESRELRGIAPVSLAQATAALQSATDRLGSQGRIAIQGDRATLTLTGVNTGALKSWLGEARSAARARPVEAQLTRAASGYSGTIVLSLGGAP